MNQLFRLPIAKHAGWWGAVVLVCRAFAFKALGLIDATSLGSDELYTVGKSFQGLRCPMGDASAGHPSASLLLASVALGAAVGQSAVILRLLSWLAYGLGAVVMVALLAFWALRPANLFAVGC